MLSTNMPVLPDTAPSRRRATFLTAALLVAGLGCGNSVNALSGAGTAGTNGGGTGGYTGPNLGQGGDGKIPVGTAQCSDGIDNDHDGRTDYDDPECVGPLDNDESSFATGIPGDNVDPCKQDCFFDGNSGMGDDHCDWDLKCDPANPGQALGCPYDSNANNCPGPQSQKCVDSCRKLTPNGCDCFGCCAIPNVGSLLLMPTCTAAKFNDPVACPRCTQSTSCTNTCKRCE